jgi:antirestriction protein ArdC
LAAKVSPEEKLVASLITLLEAGTTPWRREWDAVSAGLHVNLLSGRRYRGANPALLALGMHLRESALPYWCGFAEAKALGLFPRQGSKAVHVLRPQVHQRGEDPLAEAALADTAGTDGTGAAGRDAAGAGRRWVRYKPVAVFNAVDLEGEVLEELSRSAARPRGWCSGLSLSGWRRLRPS